MNRMSFGTGATCTDSRGVSAQITIDRMDLKGIYRDYGLNELPENLLQEAFVYLEEILYDHLRAAVDNAIGEFIIKYGDTPVESVAESLFDAGDLEKPVCFFVGGDCHTAMLGKRDKTGMVPLLFDGSPHWKKETVRCPQETSRVIFMYEVEPVIAAFSRDVRRKIFV